MTNLPYFLALNRIADIGPQTAKKLLKRWPNLSVLFALPMQALTESGLNATLAKAIHSFNMSAVDADLLWQSQDKHHLLTWESPDYPPLLREIHNPPIVLYAIGQLAAVKQPTLAMVGSRSPSFTGSENARQFAKELAMHGITVVSGLALGIDAHAHRGCLDAQGMTIAVMGTGIDCIYPRRHQALAEEIMHTGLLLTEFPLKSPPIAGHFPRRNRIISGLSFATMVVEAAVKSGSLITARLASEQNRDVFAIPGSIHNPLARGCHYLLQQGAKLVTSVRDILDELPESTIQTSMPDSVCPLASKETNLVKCIGFETTTVDHMIARSGYTVEQVISELATLELQGLIKTVSGGYIRCTYER